MMNHPPRASDSAPGDLSLESVDADVALPSEATGTRSPLRRTPWAVRTDSVHLWPRATHAALVMTGLLLAAATAIVVLRMPDLPFHPARDAELRATVEAYGQTGVLLVKENGTGSWYGRIPGEGLVRAAGDDDPGTYLIASAMTRLLGTTDPYVGLRLVMALLCAFPMLLLPMTMARVFGRARAGYAMLLLPPVTWLVNRGTVLVGTALGLRDEASPTRVYALYGLAASAAFASLVLLTYFATRKLSRPALVGASLLVVVAAAGGNLLRSMSGLGIAAAVGVLWWVHHTGKWRTLTALAVSAAAVVVSMWLPSIAMETIDSARRQVIFNQGADLPSSHGVWHPFYLGLSYPQPITGEPSRFGVEWSDTWAWEKAQRVDPGVLPASEEYDAIVKDFYLDEIRTHPAAAMRLYGDKALYTLKYFAAMVVVILLGLALAFQRAGVHRRRVAVA